MPKKNDKTAQIQKIEITNLPKPPGEIKLADHTSLEINANFPNEYKVKSKNWFSGILSLVAIIISLGVLILNLNISRANLTPTIELDRFELITNQNKILYFNVNSKPEPFEGTLDVVNEMYQLYLENSGDLSARNVKIEVTKFFLNEIETYDETLYPEDEVIATIPGGQKIGLDTVYREPILNTDNLTYRYFEEGARLQSNARVLFVIKITYEDSMPIVAKKTEWYHWTHALGYPDFKIALGTNIRQSKACSNIKTWANKNGDPVLSKITCEASDLNNDSQK